MRPRAWILLASLVFLLVAPRSGVAGSLTPDGRAGIVTAVQGVSVVRPVGRERWTPLDARGVVFPGDVIRTEARGANALELRMADGARIVVGPGALLEMPNEGGLRLVRGDVEVAPAEKTPLRVTGAGGYGKDLAATTWLRADDTGVKELPKVPRWLEGYRASTSEEWMGSLLAKVDGKDVPLTVGYHKVTVEIRDQIARTTVEESFVNATKEVLEGSFSFPLPADASIGGFGMWVGDELVEADIVEKQRAREIYEDILRRKKDPGLLEWEGGNLFKARVYPIPPHAEKRIRIRYTQVLPLEGDAWRYRYALRSELLRLHPLRELSMSVSVVSTAAIREVSSPTHPITTRKTEHEAVIEFGAQEYVPERDFEVAVGVARGEPLTAIANRAGADGHFMLLLTPPDPAAGGWQRDLAPEGAPLDLLLVADTSGSMDAKARTVQSDLIAALLAQLSEKDRVRLLVMDVVPTWVVPEPLPATEANAKGLLDALAARPSLGWTDLDAAFEAALGKAGAGTQVIYVGDGIQTAKNPDPVACADRLRKIAKDSKATVHAVSTSAAYEQGVLEAMASVGGGSVRRADAEPAAAAKALLAEVAKPGLRDAKLSIEGIPTAAVYPAVLPNVPLGQQQVILGRFLPGAEGKSATVVLTGTVAGAPVRWTSTLAAPTADAGNSFLPRLWARRHLDMLLAQGKDPKTQEEILALSREHQLMTPYTSFLVLENDEDRARYGVERTVKRVDGERFFAEAKDKAALEIARQQMAVAKRWRVGLRRQMLAQIEGLGREQTPAVAYGWTQERAGWRRWLEMDGDGAIPVQSQNRVTIEFSERLPLLAENSDLRGLDGSARLGSPASSRQEWVPSMEADAGDLPTEESHGFEDFSAGGYVTDGRTEPLDPMGPPPPMSPPMPMATAAAPAEPMSQEDLQRREGAQADTSELADADGEVLEVEKSVDGGRAKESLRRSARPIMKSKWTSGYSKLEDGDDATFGRSLGRGEGVGGAQGAGSVGFPYLAAPAKPPIALPEPTWDPAILAALRSLDRRPSIASLPGALRLTSEWTRLHAVQGRPLSRTRTVALVSPRHWQVSVEGWPVAPMTSWLSETERGIVQRGLRLGRKRAADDADRTRAPLPLIDGSLEDWVRELARVRRAPKATREGDVLHVVFASDLDPARELHLDVDVPRSVLLGARDVLDGQVLSSWRASDFVEAAGRFWATKIESLDRDGHVVARQTLRVETLDAAAFETAFAAERTAEQDVLFLDRKDPQLADAKQAIRDGKAGFAEHLVRALEQLGRNRRDEGFASLAAAEAAAPGRPGTAWIRLSLLSRGRRGPELLVRARALARDLAAAESREGPWRAAQLRAHLGTLGAREQLALVEALRAVEEKAGPDRDLIAPDAAFRHSYALQVAGDVAAAWAERAALAKERPFDVSVVLAHAGDLEAGSDGAGAMSIVAERAVQPGLWLRPEMDALFQAWRGYAWTRRDFASLDACAKAWLAAGTWSPEATVLAGSVPYLRGRFEDGERFVTQGLGLDVATLSDPAARGACQGLLQLASGQGWAFAAPEVYTPWRAPLADLALRMVRSGNAGVALVPGLLGDWRFSRTDEARTVREALLADLTAPGAVASMPVRRLAATLGLVDWSGVESPVWRSVVDALLARWRATSDAADAEVMARLARTLLAQKSEPELTFAFLRERLSKAGPLDVPDRAQDLLATILSSPHDATREAEAFDLLGKALDPLDGPEARSRDAAATARRLSTWIRAARLAAALGTPEEQARRTRAEARTQAREAGTKANAETAARLAAALPTAPPEHRPWLELERLGYAAESGADAPAVETAAKAVLSDIPPTSELPLDRLRARRATLVLEYLATRRKTPEGLADRVVAWLGEREAAKDPRIDARAEIYRLLVALDRPDALEKALAGWIRPEEADLTWRLALAYVQAETGRLPEAVVTLETASTLGDLPADAWSLLANGYLIAKEDARRDRALERALEAMPEWQLNNRLYQEASRLERSGPGVPAELDPEILRLLRVYLRTTEHPAQGITHPAQMYRATKDFRLLESLADGIVGHSPEAIYDFIDRVRDLVEGIHEEATCQALAERLARVLSSVKEPTDRRGLLLVVSAVERRAAAVQHADPAHGAAAVAALVGAFEGAFADGERRHYAVHLAALGSPPEPALAAKQLEQLEALVAQADTPRERLTLGFSLSQALWARGQGAKAVDRLWTWLAAAREAAGGAPIPELAPPYEALLGWWAALGRWRQAEGRLLADIEREPRLGVRDRLRLRLHRLYADALDAGGATSLGSGVDLYRGAVAALEKSLLEGPASELSERLGYHARLHPHDNSSKAFVVPRTEYETFARDRVGAILDRVPLEATQLLQSVLSHLEELRGPLPPLAISIGRIERESPWPARIGVDTWSRLSGSMAWWRQKAGRIGDLEPRLLPIVLRHLEQDLSAGSSWPSGGFCHRNHETFWAEHKADYAAVAARVAEVNADRASIALNAAVYQREGLGLRREAIDTLTMLLAHGKEPVDVRHTLAQWLREDGRFGEALPHAGRWLREEPGDATAVVLTSAVYHGLGRDPDALRTLEAAVERWKTRKEWQQYLASQMAHAAYEAKQPKAAATWIEDALRMRRESGGRGGPDAQLSEWYQLLARARSGLGETDAAVKAAAAAIVARGGSTENRQDAMAALRQVLTEAKDLDAWTAAYEAEVAAAGLDAPTIRKAVAGIYRQRGRNDRAIAWARAARDLDPADAEVHKLLLDALDAFGDSAGAVEALMASLRMAPKNLAAYPDLAARYARTGDEASAERARTNLVEAMPSEPDGWRELAKLRSGAGRHDLAAGLWLRVTEIRPNEPEGWLTLIAERLEAGDKDGARTALDHVDATTWDERFGDVRDQAAKLRVRLR